MTVTDTEVVLEADGLTKHFPVRRGVRDLLTRDRKVVHAVDDIKPHAAPGPGDRAGRRVRLGQVDGRPAARPVVRAYGGRHPAARRVRHGAAAAAKFRAYCRRVQMIFQDPFASLNPTHTIRYHLTRCAEDPRPGR